MSADNQVILTRVDLDVVNGNRRKIVLKLRPASATVTCIECAYLVPNEEKVGCARMLANHLNRRHRKIRLDRRPRLAVVRALQDVRVEVVAPMSVERRVHRTLAVTRRHHPAHIRLAGNAGELLYLRPRRTAVARDLNETVVGSDVDQSLPDRRFVDRADVAVVGCSCVARDCRLGPRLPHQRKLVAIEMACEIAAELLPAVASVRALEEILRAEVHSVVIVR